MPREMERLLTAKTFDKKVSTSAKKTERNS